MCAKAIIPVTNPSLSASLVMDSEGEGVYFCYVMKGEG